LRKYVYIIYTSEKKLYVEMHR